MTRPSHRQRGAAVLTALLIVSLAAILAASMFWQQQVLANSVRNGQSMTQSQWLMRSALDWAGVILREDARTTAIDHLGEPWAVPLAPTRWAPEDSGEEATVSGSMEDAQARFNLFNLVANQPDEGKLKELAALRRLLALLKLDEGLADTIAARLQRAYPRPIADQPPPAPTATAPREVEDLIGEPGLDAGAAQKLKPYVTVLPVFTSINANTASAEVLSARVDGLSLTQARQLVATRQSAPFRGTAADVLQHVPQAAANVTERELTTTTRFFVARGYIALGRSRLSVEALLMREQNVVSTVWHREVW